MSLEAKIESLTAAVEALTEAVLKRVVPDTDAEVKPRKTRTKPEAPVVEAPVVEAPVVEAPAVDMEVLKAKFRQFMSARGSADARAVLTEFGVPPTGKLVDLPADKYGVMHAKLCEELGA